MKVLLPVTCDVCGEAGLGSPRTSAAAWDPDLMVRHRDRRICRANLAAKSVNA